MRDYSGFLRDSNHLVEEGLSQREHTLGPSPPGSVYAVEFLVSSSMALVLPGYGSLSRQVKDSCAPL